MTNLPAIRVEHLWKQYVLGKPRQQHRTFYDLLASAISSPVQRVRDLRGGATAAESFWALQDVSFEIQTGEVVGVIGRNGAGKSTLLKTLSRITAPTRGMLTVTGRLASLLEVGTGFHPELTGRENIFLNGAILGMTRREIERQFDEIVAFAEVEKFIDTPVKHYSSGMYVRLAFAVAAHLEADVLLVDEVLAVGDAAFQRKSLARMGDVAKGGKTVFFVSHNLSAVRNLCSRLLLLDRGALTFDGSVEHGLSLYEASSAEPGRAFGSSSFQGPLSNRIGFQRLLYRQGGSIVEIVDPLSDFSIELHGHAEHAFAHLNVNLKLYRDGVYIGSCFDAERDSPMAVGEFVSIIDVPGRVLRSGRYTIGVGAGAPFGEWIWGPDVAVLTLSETGGTDDRTNGIIAIPHSGARNHGM